MILCLTGTNPYSFERLVKKINQTIAKKHRVVIQLGNTNYKPENSEYFDFCNKSRVLDLMEEAELIITHGGYGSMIDAIKLNKAVIAVPRKMELKESLDDQIELVKYFDSKNYVKGCYNINNLESLVEKVLKDGFCFEKFKPESDFLIKDLISEYLEML